MTEENKEISRKDLLEKEKLLRNLNKYVAYIDLDSAQSLTDSYWWKHLEIEGIPSWWYDESGFRVLPALLDQKFYDEDAISGNGEGISFLKSKNYDKVFSKKFYRFVDLRLLNLDDFSSITPDADDQKVLQKQKQVILKTLDQVIEKGRERFSTNESSSKNKSALH